MTDLFLSLRYWMLIALLAAMGSPFAWAQHRSGDIKTASLAPRTVDTIVAIVNTEPITQSELEARRARLVQQWAAQGVQPPAPDQLLKQVLERLIQERAVVQAARESGIKVTEEQLQQAVAAIARKNNLSSTGQLRVQMQREGVNWSEFLNEIRNELTLQQVNEREVEARVRVTDAEVELALRDPSYSGTQSYQINLAHILIAIPENASKAQIEALQQKARQVQSQAANGADFLALARTYSEAADKEQGGELGLRPMERIPPLFLSAVESLKVGAVTPVLRSEAGFHIVKLLAREAQTQMAVTQTHARHILLTPNNGLSLTQAKQRLLAIRNRIELNQITFAQAAERYSIDGSAKQGGDLGWTNPGTFVPVFERAMNALRIGDISEPVVTQFGVHLIEVLERREWKLSLDEQRQVVRERLREKKAQEALQLWLAEVRNRAFVEIRAFDTNNPTPSSSVVPAASATVK